MMLPRMLGLLLLLIFFVATAGCTSGSSEAKSESGSSKAEAPLLEPFTPPTLAELDQTAEWTDHVPVDLIELLRKKQAGEKLLATTAEALRLKNDSPEENAKILSALGRLPEERDGVEVGVDWNAQINRCFPTDIKTTNPIMVSSTYDMDVADLTGLTLFGFDWTMQPSALKDTVVSWQTSKDRLVDKVILRDDLTWSDGVPITAHDVVFSFQTIMDPRVPVPAVRSGPDKLRWVHAYDDHTLVFFHKEALPTGVEDISFPTIPRHIYEKSREEDPTLSESVTHVKYENEPVCGGPYMMTSRKRGQEIVLTRRDDWSTQGGKQVRHKPYFTTIRIRIIEDSNTALLALKAGEIEETILMPEQWTTQTNDDNYYQRNTKASGLEWVYFYFGWNNKTPFFSDVRVRQAMSYAFNYEEMLNKLLYGLYEPSNGVFHRTAWMAPKNPAPPYHQDLSKAEQLLDEAGWTDHDGDGIRDKEIGGRTVPFEFTLVCPNLAERVAICTLLKENLDQIGVTCNVRPLEFTVLQQMTMDHDFQAMFGGWGTGTDPSTSENLWVTGQPRNFVNYSNPQVDALYKQGGKEFDLEKRAEIYGKIHELMYADQPCTWLYFRNSFNGFSKTLRGYHYSPRGPFLYNPGFRSFWKPLP